MLLPTPHARAALAPVHNTLTSQVRTQTLVKNAIVQIDAAPFKQWYLQHYGTELGQKKGEDKKEEVAAPEAKVGARAWGSCVRCGCGVGGGCGGGWWLRAWA
jgi:hypothetical protein